MNRLSITEKSLAEARTILQLWSNMAVDPKKKALIAPVIELLSVKRNAPGGKQVTFFITSENTPDTAPAPLIELEPTSKAWPNGCIKPNSCARHKHCMYGCEAHKSRIISTEVDRSIEDMKKKAPWELEPGVGL